MKNPVAKFNFNRSVVFRDKKKDYNRKVKHKKDPTDV